MLSGQPCTVTLCTLDIMRLEQQAGLKRDSVSCRCHADMDTEHVMHCLVMAALQAGPDLTPTCCVACSGAVSHETRHYIHLRVDSYNIILWKSKDSLGAAD